MSRRILGVVGLTMFLGAALPRVASAEVWKCTFEGTWDQEGKSQGDFVWNVTWTGADKSWKITGTASDDLGNSETTGTCDDETCRFQQLYTSGKEKGNTYYYQGTYTDEETKSEDVMRESFKGTWGLSAKDRKSGGAWRAKALCKAS